MEKRNLFLDVDGCVLNFDHAYIPILAKEGLQLNDNDFKQWEILKFRGYTRRQVYRFIVKTWESEEFENLPYIFGAKKFLKWASKKYNIIYNTILPEVYHEKRIKNLEKLGILKDINAQIKFAKSHRDKSRIVGKYDNVIGFVDDKPKNVSAVKEDWPDIITIWYNHGGFMNVYGYDPEPDYEAHSWLKAKKILQKVNGR
jgi:hypothetical protein